MLTDTLQNISDFLSISNTVIPNLITLSVVTVLVIISFRGAVDWKLAILLYMVSMAILTLLGIDSVFNLITLIENGIDAIWELIFMGVIL